MVTKQLALKRAFDVALVVMTAWLWLPFVGIVAIMVRQRLGSPVFFRQRRPGLHGREFSLIKFRTMTDMRDPKGQLLPDGLRLTEFGRWLRRTSLDELPELFNVVKGEMSLVGPRPLLIEYLPRYNRRQASRHETLPGITGWAQIHGRNNVPWAERLELDVWYVENRSLMLDVKILFKTVGQVLTGVGVQVDTNDGEGEFQ